MESIADFEEFMSYSVVDDVLEKTEIGICLLEVSLVIQQTDPRYYELDSVPKVLVLYETTDSYYCINGTVKEVISKINRLRKERREAFKNLT